MGRGSRWLCRSQRPYGALGGLDVPAGVRGPIHVSPDRLARRRAVFGSREVAP